MPGADLAVGQLFVRMFGRTDVFELMSLSNIYVMRFEADGIRLHVRVNLLMTGKQPLC